MTTLRLVFRSPWNVPLGSTAFVTMAVFYLWSRQVLIMSRQGIAVLVQTRFVVAGLIMALSCGLVVPVLAYAARVAAASSTQTGGTSLGAVPGTMFMACCAPVIMPVLLSLLQFSGTATLGLNETLNRFWLPLAIVGAVLLIYSLVSVVRSFELVCTVNTAADVASTDSGFREAAAAKRASLQSE